MKNIKLLLGGLVLGSTLALTGCVVQPAHDHGYGPPPHAPAHGYRHKYHDHDLVYDAGLGVYLLIGVPDIYFIDDFYYRHSHDGWFYSRKFDKDWKPYKDYRKLPPGLAKKYGDHGDDHGYGRGKDDDKDHGKGHDKGHGKDDDDHGHGDDDDHGHGHGRD